MAKAKMLDGITLVDLGVGMATALIAKFAQELGAKVIRIEPPGGDPFYQIYAAYDVWRRGATVAPTEQLHQLLADADICLIGGEDHPDIIRRTDIAELVASHPRLIVLNIEGYPVGTEDAGRPAADLLVQARAGMTWEHYTDRPIAMSFEPAAYGAALRGLCGLLAALYEREGSGRGQIVATSLFEGVLSWLVSIWCDMEKPTPAANFVMPKDPYPLVFRAADGQYLHLVIGAPGSKYLMYQALEVDDPSVTPESVSMPQPSGDPKKFYGDFDVLAAHVAKQPSTELLERIWARGLPAEPVLAPGACWDTPQVRHNGIIETDPDGGRHVGNPIISRASPAPYQGPPKVSGLAPLSGVTVVDFGAFIAGPFASAVLADLGATVIKVETPAGDPGRSIHRSFTSGNKGKQAIVLDLKTAEGSKIAKSLCLKADITTNNFRTGVSARLGIDPASLHEVKSGLIVLESPGYGSSGPLSERAAFDMVMQAFCGHEHRAGGEGNEPLWNRTSMVDYAGGFLGAIGSLAALYHRAHTGEGMTLDISLLAAGVYLLSELVQRADGSFEGAETLNAARTGFRPAEALYQTADGWIAVVARGRAAGTALAHTLDLPLDSDPSNWDTDAGAAIATAVASRSTVDAAVALEQAGVWVEVCRIGVDLDILRDSAMERANVVQVSVHPKFGTVRELGAMLRYSRSRAGHRNHAPLKGETTQQILTALGLDGDEIAALAEKKVIA